MHNQLSPVYAGELQCIALGMAAKIYDDSGKEITSYSHPGELICDRPFPSQPIYFLGDSDGSKYRSAYYERFPDVWHHADFVQFEKTGGIVMLGRSDGVLNPSGVRFGSAEIYGVTESIPEIVDALCVGQRRPQDDDETVILFVMTRKEQDFSPELIQRIKGEILRALTPRHG